MKKLGFFRVWFLIFLLTGGMSFGAERSKGPQAAGGTKTQDETLREIAKQTRWARPETLVDHFRRHGDDFGAKSPEEYAKMASDFFFRAKKENLPLKTAPGGTLRIYDRKTNTFGAYTAGGRTKTFFKPKEGVKYWNRQ